MEFSQEEYWDRIRHSICDEFPTFHSSAQLDPDSLDALLDLIGYVKGAETKPGMKQVLSDKIVAGLFYEPSSRTRLSFESAALRLGANTIAATGASSSSLKKGESIVDTIKIIGSYADLIVIRQSKGYAFEEIAPITSVPVINGGDGDNEHPTQALTDAYTVRSNLNRLDTLKISIGFDARHSRSIKSFSMLMSMFPKNSFRFISPPGLEPPESLVQYLEARGSSVAIVHDLEGIGDCDILYLNRFQRERFANEREFDHLVSDYCVSDHHIRNSACIILDPLPRVGEIDYTVDALPQARYFEQSSNGIPVRMALLALLLGRAGRLYEAATAA